MPSPPKVFIHNMPYEICTSVRSGLPLVATDYMKFLIEGILASAQTLFPVTICHYVVMANHIHLIIVVENPEHVHQFMRHFKTELSHAINRLLGKTGESFWVDGYDSVIILSPEKLLERMEYIYLNPQRAGLVRTIQEYPGLHTYSALSSERTEIAAKKISRDALGELPQRVLTKAERQHLAHTLSEGKGAEYSLVVEPWAWLKCFSSSWKREELYRNFQLRIAEKERSIALEKKTVLGAHALESQDIRTPYKSKRRGKKMLCLSDCPRQRSSVINFLKTQTTKARDDYQRRKAGDRNALPTPVFFLPGGALLANLVFPILLL